MPDALQLLIPHAANSAQGCQHVLKELQLPHLERLLARLELSGTDSGEETDFAPPHERALANALGLPASPQGITPWAAWEQHRQNVAGSTEHAWAYITPCQWHVSSDHVTMLDPQELQLTAESTQALLAIVNPWFAEDGITLAYDQPGRWIARGPVFDQLATASLDRVILRDVRAWMPDAMQARVLHRLQSEMQMLLYTHAFNDARAEENLPPVNTFWVHGAGKLPPGFQAQPAPEMPLTLRDTAVRGNWQAWAKAWSEIDAGPLAQLEQHVANGGQATLTLSGEHTAMRWQTGAKQGFAHKLKRMFGKSAPRFAEIQNQL